MSFFIIWIIFGCINIHLIHWYDEHPLPWELTLYFLFFFPIFLLLGIDKILRILTKDNTANFPVSGDVVASSVITAQKVNDIKKVNDEIEDRFHILDL